MISTINENGRIPVKMWANVLDVESSALDQLKNVASLPNVFHHVAVMPDVHYGKGATVGSVIATHNAISPACVGVDISCGCSAARLNINASALPENLKEIRNQIERDVPVGFNAHKTDRHFSRLSLSLKNRIHSHFAKFDDLDPHVRNLQSRAHSQIGTLGGGNHFIELCLDTEDRVWLMLHSGSRNIGKELAEIHIGKAKELSHNQSLKDRDLAFFLSGTPEMAAYRKDLYWAQDYAALNRETMLELCKDALKRFFPELEFEETISCHHNYVSEELHFGEHVFVTRKGAIFAGQGTLGIIPGSMGTKSFIVRGLGNPESFQSASHGAGRRMSRGKAKKAFSLEDLKRQTAGVECRKDAGVLDEIPGAYKSIDAVMENQKDLVSIVATLKQVLCIKG